MLAPDMNILIQTCYVLLCFLEINHNLSDTLSMKQNELPYEIGIVFITLFPLTQLRRLLPQFQISILREKLLLKNKTLLKEPGTQYIIYIWPTILSIYSMGPQGIFVASQPYFSHAIIYILRPRGCQTQTRDQKLYVHCVQYYQQQSILLKCLPTYFKKGLASRKCTKS